MQADALKGASKNLGRGNQTTKPKKNTVASLLAQTRRDSEQGLASSHPELTIEPIFRSTPSQVRTYTTKEDKVRHLFQSSSLRFQSPAAHGDDDFDQSLGGRRISAYYDSDGAFSVSLFQVSTLLSGRLGIKNVSESPEIRNISERGDRGSSEDPEELGSEAECIEGESERTKRAFPANCSRPPVPKPCLDIRDSREVCSLGAASVLPVDRVL